MKKLLGKLKQAICDYYMSYVKQKFSNLLANGREAELNEQIMQFLDAQLTTGNNHISKDDIVRILSSVLTENNYSDSYLEQGTLPYCFPNTSDVIIEDGNAALLTEKHETPFNGIVEKSYYLYVSPNYYNGNIEIIEATIKRLEKGFSRQDIKGFEEKFQKDLGTKQYELESAKVFESASNQIDLKKQKFNSVSSKLINDYGRKYQEIISKDIDVQEKKELVKKLFDETKSYDERNSASISRLNLEYEQLNKNFQGKVQDSKTIYKQMQNLHLFDKNRYFEDMMSSVTPELRDLYKKRYLLNSYRLSHNEMIYTGKQNVFASFFTNLVKGLKGENTPLLLGPHFERELPTRKS